MSNHSSFVILLIAGLMLPGCGGEPFRVKPPSGRNGNQDEIAPSPPAAEKPVASKPPQVEEGSAVSPPAKSPLKEEPVAASGQSSDLDQLIAAKEKELEELRVRAAAAREAERLKASPKEVAELRSNLQKKEAEWREKSKQAAATETDHLTHQVSSLRRQLAIAEGKAGVAVRSVGDLFAGMPASSFPKYGPEGGIARKAAREWLARNLVGRTIEWKRAVTTVKIDGNDPYDVSLVVDSGSWLSRFEHAIELGKCELGPTKCRVLVSGDQFRGYGARKASIRYTCNESDGRLLLELKEKEAAFHALIVKTDLFDESSHDFETGKPDDHVQIVLYVEAPAVNGFIPSPVARK